MKYVLVTGGVVSGLGKGITSSSIGVLLRACGIITTSIKIDPYINVDAGTMSPYEHGEVFVLDDGGEGDLDLGNYERFLHSTLTRDHNITTGKIYSRVISMERRGDYLGKTVQVVPHITDAIQEWIERVAQIPVNNDNKTPEVCLIELGGTVGDIESMIFLEAMRQFVYRMGHDNCCIVHVSLVPVVGAVGEPKSKPTQHGVRELRAAGLSPDIIICRSTTPLRRDIVGKIALACMVSSSHVISVHDVSNIYKVPLLLLEQRVPGLVLDRLRINKMPPEDIKEWRTIAMAIDDNTLPIVHIGIVGKYTGLSDSYLSVTKSLEHAGAYNRRKVQVHWIESTKLEDSYKASKPDLYDAAWTELKTMDGILIPGGFGDRGVEGKILAIQWCRDNRVPFFGICLGMQLAVIEYCRNVVKIQDATSQEFNEDTPSPAIVYMPEISQTEMGGTMRLGARVTHLKEYSLAYQLYNYEKSISERHRHRYEVNPEYIEPLEKAGLVFSGRDEKQLRMECVELPGDVHPFFFGVQFHPEFKSRPTKPSPCFDGFIKAAGKLLVRKTLTEVNSIVQQMNNAHNRRNAGSPTQTPKSPTGTGTGTASSNNGNRSTSSNNISNNNSNNNNTLSVGFKSISSDTHSNGNSSINGQIDFNCGPGIKQQQHEK